MYTIKDLEEPSSVPDLMFVYYNLGKGSWTTRPGEVLYTLCKTRKVNRIAGVSCLQQGHRLVLF